MFPDSSAPLYPSLEERVDVCIPNMQHSASKRGPPDWPFIPAVDVMMRELSCGPYMRDIMPPLNSGRAEAGFPSSAALYPSLPKDLPIRTELPSESMGYPDIQSGSKGESLKAAMSVPES